MKVKFVKNKHDYRYLTIGKEYEAEFCKNSSFDNQGRYDTYRIINDVGEEVLYNARCFEVVEMEKQIVTIDVGSKYIWNKSYCEVTSIDLIEHKVHDDLNMFNKFSVFTPTINKQVISINGIPFDQISEVRIAGYNDKVTLKIGDIVSLLECYKDSLKKAIKHFKNPECHWTDVEDIDWELCDARYWWVNGKLYNSKNIIIPNQSVDTNEMNQPEGSEMFEPITPENFKDVWANTPKPENLYNNVKNFSVTTFTTIGIWEACILNEQIKTKDFNEFLTFVQKRIELKPLPKFDFKQYLLDNGFKGSNWLNNNSIALYPNINNSPDCNCKVTFAKGGSNGFFISQTKANADKLIAMAKLAEELE